LKTGREGERERDRDREGGREGGRDRDRDSEREKKGGREGERQDLARHAPPARHQEPSSPFGIHILEVCDLGRVGVAPEGVLLAVGGAEDPYSKNSQESKESDSRGG
jgi:hypothetical protein